MTLTVGGDQPWLHVARPQAPVEGFFIRFPRAGVSTVWRAKVQQRQAAVALEDGPASIG